MRILIILAMISGVVFGLVLLGVIGNAVSSLVHFHGLMGHRDALLNGLGKMTIMFLLAAILAALRKGD